MAFYYPTGVRSALAPVTLIYNFFGLGLIEYPTGQPRKIPGLLYSAVLVFSYIIRRFYFRSIDSLFFANVGVSSNEYFTPFINHCWLISHVLCCIVASIVCNKKRLNYITKLERINKKLKSIGINRSQRSVTAAEIFLLVALVWCIIFTIYDISLFIVRQKNSIGILWILTTFWFMPYPLMLIISAMMMYCHFNTMVKQSFEDLNSFLESMKSQYANDSNVGGNNSSEGDTVARDKQNVEIIYGIRKIHANLIGIAKGWNHIHAAIILASVLLYLRSCSSEGIMLYGNVKISGIYSFSSLKFLLNLSKIAFSIGILITVIRSSVSLTSEVHRTFEILMQPLHPIIPLRPEVRIFSMQIVQNPFHLSVYGLFALDYSLLQEIFVFVITYVITYEQSSKA